VEKGICFQPGLLYFHMVFFVNFRLLGRLSGVDVNFLLCLSVAVVCSWMNVVGCQVLVVDCAGCRSVLPSSVLISAPRELLSQMLTTACHANTMELPKARI
jgi:hypothetical protein